MSFLNKIKNIFKRNDIKYEHFRYKPHLNGYLLEFSLTGNRWKPIMDDRLHKKGLYKPKGILNAKMFFSVASINDFIQDYKNNKFYIRSDGIIEDTNEYRYIK